MTRPTVRVAFCADCGYEGHAAELARALFVEFGHRIAEVRLIPWDDASFDVSVGDELVHSMERDGGMPEPALVIERVRAALATATKEA